MKTSSGSLPAGSSRSSLKFQLNTGAGWNVQSGDESLECLFERWFESSSGLICLRGKCEVRYFCSDSVVDEGDDPLIEGAVLKAPPLLGEIGNGQGFDS